MQQNGFHRRLAAILSADVAGYRRLMQDDEAERTHHRHRKRRPLAQPARSALHHALRHGVINSENLKMSIEDPCSELQGIFDRTRYGLF